MVTFLGVLKMQQLQSQEKHGKERGHFLFWLSRIEKEFPLVSAPYCNQHLNYPICSLYEMKLKSI